MLGQPVSMLLPAGRRLQALRQAARRARPRPTSSSPSPRCCARRASSASSSSSTAPASRSCRSPTARRSPTWRPSTARRAASSRSTRRRSLPALHRPHRGARQARRGVREGAGALPHDANARSGVHRHARRSISARSSRASPGPRARRIACASGREGVVPRGLGTLHAARARRRRSRSRWKARAGDAGHGADEAQRRARVERRHDVEHGSVVIAAITSCTNTSNPSVLIAAGLLAKKAVEKGLTAKPWVKTSLAPGSKVVTEYLDAAGPADVPRAARLQPRRLRLHDVHRQQRPAAGRRCVGRHRRGRPRRRRGAQRQPQLRRARPPRGARELPRVAAARRRVRARGQRRHRSRRTSRSARARTASPVFLKDIWPTQQEVADTIGEVRHRGDLQEALREGLRGRRTGSAPSPEGRPLRVGRSVDVREAPAVLRRHAAHAPP